MCQVELCQVVSVRPLAAWRQGAGAPSQSCSRFCASPAGARTKAGAIWQGRRSGGARRQQVRAIEDLDGEAIEVASALIEQHFEV